MVKILKIMVATALVAGLVAGLTTTTCCDGTDSNGETPDGEPSNGHTPNESELDLTSGLGYIIECADTVATNIEIGDSLPDFTFQDANGQPFFLSDFNGKSVMLNFWRISCHWCAVEMPYIQQVYDHWPNEDVVILTINVADSAEEVVEFLQEHELSLPVLLDTKAELAISYLVNSYPLSFFIDKGGAFQGVWPGALLSAEQLESILEQLSALEGG